MSRLFRVGLLLLVVGVAGLAAVAVKSPGVTRSQGALLVPAEGLNEIAWKLAARDLALRIVDPDSFTLDVSLWSPSARRAGSTSDPPLWQARIAGPSTHVVPLEERGAHLVRFVNPEPSAITLAYSRQQGPGADRALLADTAAIAILGALLLLAAAAGHGVARFRARSDPPSAAPRRGGR